MKILLAIDGSPYSAPPVREVVTRSWPPGSVVRVLTVVEDVYPPPEPSAPDAGPAPGASPALTEAQEALWRSAQALVTGVAQELERSGLGVEPVARRGDPASIIVEEARAWGADVVFVGSHGRTGLKRILMGSVAQSVVANAPCSVEVVRNPEEHGERAGTPR